MPKTKIFVTLFSLMSCFVFAAEWPGWRGPLQNGVSIETGLISQWSVQGENLIWRSDFRGRSTPVVMNGRVYVAGRTGDGMTMQEHVACFDAGNGKLIWEKKLHVYHSTVPFSRAGWASLAGDPETGNVYAHGVGGLLICFDKDGKVLWIRSLTEEFGHLSGFGGRTDTPVVDEDLLILGFVNAGWGDQAAPRHRYFAFDKRTGELVWVSNPGGAPYDFNIYSTPVVAVINGQRLLIGGNGDGSIYALKVRTGEKVWGFQLSKRGINSSVVVDGNKVYAGHSEENLDEATMGRVVCIDATGTGDVTKTHELWRYDRLEVGYTSPVIHDGKLYEVDNSANLYSIDAQTGKLLWRQRLGTVGKGSPVWADKKLYATEVNGAFLILQPGDQDAKVLDTEKILIGNRGAEIYGSPAIAYGRIYFTTEEGIYCIGDKKAKFSPAAGKHPAKKSVKTSQTQDGSTPSAIQVVPAEVYLKPGDSVQFKVRAFDAKGEFLRETKATWSATGGIGTIDENAKLVAANGTHAGILTAQAGELKATARVRVVPDLPLQQDFESIELEKSPSDWIASTGKFFVREKDGKKVLVKPPVERGLQTAEVYIGPWNWSGYTVQTDILGTKSKRKMPDVGLLNSGYSMILLGNHQRLQILSWASELRIDKKLDFAWSPDVWYTMKFRVDVANGKGILRGKVWPASEKEPEAWSIEAEDPLPIDHGSPGIYGNSNSEIYYDNVKVLKSTS